MKSTVKLILGVSLIICLTVPGLSFDRIVMFELFTSTTCPPCATTVPFIDAFLESMGPDNVVQVAYHMNWPGAGNDPFYLNNPSENTARRTYYGINAVPNLKVDGILGNTASFYQTYYNQRTNVWAPVNIELDINVGTTINVTADITAESNYTGYNLKFHSALIAKEYDIPGGGWTYTHCEWAMLDMAPNAYGQNFNIGPGETVTMNASFPIPTWPPTGMENLAVVCFVQNDAIGGEVLNARYEPIPLDYPSLYYAANTIVDTLNGNGNGKAEPGETAEIWLNMGNTVPFAPAFGIVGTLSTNDPEVIITGATASFPDIQPGSTGSNQADPFVFDVATTLEAHFVTFQLNVTSNGGTYQASYLFDAMIGLPEYLIVADDGGTGWEEYFISDFVELDLAYDMWNVDQQGSPSFDDLDLYPHVIWMTGQESSTLTQYEQDELADYLDAGNNLFMSSQNLNDDIGNSDFYDNYMHAQSQNNFVATTTLTGLDGSPIAEGTSLILIGGAYWPTSSSSIIPNPEAVAAYHYNNPTQSIGALTYEGDYKLAYFAFSYECISPTTTSHTQRPEVLDNVLEWFGEGGPTPEVSVILIPLNPPILIPANGGQFTFDIGIANNSAFAVDVDIWTFATLPNGTPYGPIINAGPVTRPPGSSATRQRDQNVPAGAPTGSYTYDAYIGDYPDDIWDEAHFDFEKLAVSDGGAVVPGWDNWGESFADLTGVTSSPVASEFALGNAYPNPFNPETILSFTIPHEGNVSLKVYNISGREVANLLDGALSAGEHTVNFNAKNLSSGIYFARLEASGNIATIKLLLTK